MKTFKPLITEKTLALAKSENKYTFLVDPFLRKHQVKELINRAFDVTVVNVSTSKIKGAAKRNLKTKILVRKSDAKRVVVQLPEKQKIGLFETEKKKSKSRKA